jgi:hypothetical protein
LALTVQQSILAAAAIVGIALILAKVIAPYEIAPSPTASAWRLNRITGDVRRCWASGCEK